MVNTWRPCFVCSMVLVCRAAVSTYHRLGVGLKQEELTFSQCQGWKPSVKVCPSGLVFFFSEVSLLGLEMVGCLLPVSSHGLFLKGHHS